MPENSKEFDIQKLENDYPDFFKEISLTLLEFILSEETASKITEICIGNGIKDEKIEKVAYHITLILLGVTSEGGLTATLKKELGIELVIADKISRGAEKLIFSQAPLEETEETLPEEAIEKTTTETSKPPEKDTYKEPIE